MKKYWLIVLWLFMIGSPVTAFSTQLNDANPVFVSITAQGIVFSEYTTAGIQTRGALPDTFAVESLGGQAEWLIRGKPNFALSPNGQSVAFTARRGDEAALFIYTFADDNLLQRSITSYWLFPLWSPDSQALLLYAPLPYLEPVTVPDNYIYNVTDDKFIQITNSAYTDRDFHWTDDSQGIVYLGTCEYAACADRKRADYYFVSKDGSARQALTDIATQIPDMNTYDDRCNLTWSPDFERWYYEFGCATGADEGLGRDHVYSVDLSGNHRLEIDTLAYFEILYPEGELYTMDVRTIQAASSGVYLTLRMGFYPGIEPYTQTIIFQLRVLKLDFSGTMITAYEPSFPDLDNQANHFRLDGSALSPDENYMAMIVGSLLQVIDLDTGQIAAEVNPGSICDAQWLDNNHLIFNVALSDCNSVGVVPYRVEILSVLDGNVTLVFENTDDISWFLPVPNTLLK